MFWVNAKKKRVRACAKKGLESATEYGKVDPGRAAPWELCVGSCPLGDGKVRRTIHAIRLIVLPLFLGSRASAAGRTDNDAGHPFARRSKAAALSRDRRSVAAEGSGAARLEP